MKRQISGCDDGTPRVVGDYVPCQEGGEKAEDAAGFDEGFVGPAGGVQEVADA